MSKKIILTGGGTAGHVNPNIALLPTLKNLGYDISYVGSHDGIEKRLIKEEGIDYHSISTGKLRRYLSAKNLSDVFRVFKGIKEAKRLLKKLSPDVVFSKGGFVSVPVVMAAHKLNIPVIIHESDSTPGLANRISFRYVSKICVSFPETLNLIPSDKAVLTGTPIREQLTRGNRDKGLSFCGLSGDRPVLTVMGGSLGAAYVNEVIRHSLDDILRTHDVIHMCGKGNLDESLNGKKGYSQFEYIGADLPDVFAATDIIVSRAGANAIFEILALKKPNILIPLPSGASRGDQIINAESFEKSGYSMVLPQEELNTESLITAIDSLTKKAETYVSAMESSSQNQAIKLITGLIESAVG